MHTRTRLDPRYPKIPYQMDYLFASPELAERLNRCSALDHDECPSPSEPLSDRPPTSGSEGPATDRSPDSRGSSPMPIPRQMVPRRPGEVARKRYRTVLV